LCITLPIFIEVVFSNENSSLYYTTNFNDPTVIYKENTFVMILKHSYKASEGHHYRTDTLPTYEIMQFQVTQFQAYGIFKWKKLTLLKYAFFLGGGGGGCEFVFGEGGGKQGLG